LPDFTVGEIRQNIGVPLIVKSFIPEKSANIFWIENIFGIISGGVANSSPFLHSEKKFQKLVQFFS